MAAFQVSVTDIWGAPPADRAEWIAAVEASHSDFDALLSALRRGPVYAADVETGRVAGQRSVDGVVYPYFIQVPASYDPDRTYPVRVFLHGGVSRAPWNPRTLEWWRNPDRVVSEEYIGVFPASWGERPWWHPDQLDNLREILRTVRATYNVDENRAAMIGISDGGTGAYYVAFRHTTPWASFLPFIAHPAVLLNPNVGANGEIFRTNLTNKPLFIVNGDQDRLYPTRSVDPFVADFSAGGVEMVYRPLEGVGHEVGWWPDEAERIDGFIAARPRDPHPVCVSWETETAPARAHWVRIDKLGGTQRDARFDLSLLFDRGVPSGRLDAARNGNDIRLSSAGVEAATLLLSPQVFDLSQPIRVWWNGIQVHDEAVPPDVAVLAKWAAHDADRTMLYGAELALAAPTDGTRARVQLPDPPGSPFCRGTAEPQGLQP